MRLLVISDVHADARALSGVLSHARAQHWNQVLFLGDAVGYGSQAAEALAQLRSLPLRAGVRGNHEAMLEALRLGRKPNASRAVVATLADQLRELGADDLAFLDSLAWEHLDSAWGAVHGALRKPFEYMLSVPLARSNASHMKRDVYFVGHTHVPAAYLQTPGGEWRLRAFGAGGGSVVVPFGSRAFLNPGAISLPRDGKGGASYGVFDEQERTFTVFRLK